MAVILDLIDLGNCLIACITPPTVLLFLLITAAIGLVSYILLKVCRSSNLRLILIYLHITSFIFLIAIVSISMTCGMLFLNIFLPAIPILLFIGMFATYLIGPRLYLASLNAHETKDKELINWVTNYSSAIGVGTPILYTTDDPQTSAFSIYGMKPKICISSKILKNCTTEEIKAILIHEIAHIRLKTQIFKISLSFLRFLTPFSLIHSFLEDLHSEEDRADQYVKEIQGTSLHLDSAKIRIAAMIL